MRFLFSGILFTAALFLPALAGAQQTPGSSSDAGFNMVLILLVTLVVIFMFAIGVLGTVFKNLTQAYTEKRRKERSAGILPMLLMAALLLLLPGAGAFAQDAPAEGAEAVEAVSPFIAGISKDVFWFLIGILSFELTIIVVLLRHIAAMVRLVRGIPQKVRIPKPLFSKSFLDVFNKSVAVEQEADILLDHDYDGIRELDNALPPWWKYGFVLSIIVSVMYMGYYHAAGGPGQIEEYNTAVAEGEAQKAEYLAKSANNVDENTVTMVLDGAELASAENVFKSTCGACHGADGGGTVGPNLADDYWMHGGSLKDVFKSIKYGWPDKGMKSWKDDYSPKQLAALASYVKTLKGSQPAAPKAPQGELFVEGGDRAIDSVGAATDPSLKPGPTAENKDNPIGPYPVKNK